MTTPALNDDLTPAERKRQRKLPLNASGKLRELALAHWGKIADPSSRVDAVLVKSDGHVVIEWSEPTGKGNIIRDDGRFSISMDRLFKDAALEARAKEIEALRSALEPFGFISDLLSLEDGWADKDEIVLTFDDRRLAAIDLSCFRAASTALTGALNHG